MFHALQSNISDQGKPSKRLLGGSGAQKASRKRKSQYEQEVSSDKGLAVVVQRDSSQTSSEAAVGASIAAACRQQQVVGLLGDHEIPYTHQYIVDWLYQAWLDMVCALEIIMGAVSYNATGYPQGAGAGQVMLFCGTHLESLCEQPLIAWDHDVDLCVFYHGDEFAKIWNSAARQLHNFVGCYLRCMPCCY